MPLPADDLRTRPTTAPIGPPDTDAAPAVQLEDLHKTYGPVRAVDGLDLTIAPGEIVAVLGPNGAGKSTTTELIAGLTDPDAGAVARLRQAAPRAVRRARSGRCCKPVRCSTRPRSPTCCG